MKVERSRGVLSESWWSGSIVNDTNFSAIAKRRTTSEAFTREQNPTVIYRSNYFNFCFFKNVRLPKLRSRCKRWGARSTVSMSLFPKERNRRVTNCKSEADQHCFQTWVRKIYSRELLKYINTTIKFHTIKIYLCLIINYKNL